MAKALIGREALEHLLDLPDDTRITDVRFTSPGYGGQDEVIEVDIEGDSVPPCEQVELIYMKGEDGSVALIEMHPLP